MDAGSKNTLVDNFFRFFLALVILGFVFYLLSTTGVLTYGERLSAVSYGFTEFEAVVENCTRIQTYCPQLASDGIQYPYSVFECTFINRGGDKKITSVSVRDAEVTMIQTYLNCGYAKNSFVIRQASGKGLKDEGMMFAQSVQDCEPQKSGLYDIVDSVYGGLTVSNGDVFKVIATGMPPDGICTYKELEKKTSKCRPYKKPGDDFEVDVSIGFESVMGGVSTPKTVKGRIKGERSPCPESGTPLKYWT